jgi:hypothetical protein
VTDQRGAVLQAGTQRLDEIFDGALIKLGAHAARHQDDGEEMAQKKLCLDIESHDRAEGEIGNNIQNTTGLRITARLFLILEDSTAFRSGTGRFATRATAPTDGRMRNARAFEIGASRHKLPTAGRVPHPPADE